MVNFILVLAEDDFVIGNFFIGNFVIGNFVIGQVTRDITEAASSPRPTDRAREEKLTQSRWRSHNCDFIHTISQLSFYPLGLTVVILSTKPHNCDFRYDPDLYKVDAIQYVRSCMFLMS